MAEATQATTDAQAANASTDPSALVMQGLANKGTATAAAATAAKPATDTKATETTAAAADATPPGFLTRDEALKLVNDSVAAALQKDRTSRDQDNTRERFIREKMADLPQSFADLMPRTGDRAALATAEQTLRADLRAWMAKNGLKVKDISGDVAGGVAPMAMGNANATSTDLVMAGLQRVRR